MQFELNCVESFHIAMGVDFKQPMQDDDDSLFVQILAVGEQLIEYSKVLERKVGDQDKRWLRAHLLCEELGETLVAMANGDEVETLDGLTDLLYVLLGTALTFDWPLEETFHEVHQSNMSKTRSKDDPGRIRDKGDSYVPPNLKKVLEQWRIKQ